MLIESMSSLIEKSARLGSSERKEFLTNDDLNAPFNENMGDQRAKTSFFLEMCLAALENQKKLHGCEYATERKVHEVGLVTFKAPKKLNEGLGATTQEKQLDIRIFSENGSDMIVATFIPGTDGGIVVPKSIHEAKTQERYYWLRRGDDTYRIKAEGEKEAKEKLQTDHPTQEKLDAEILRVETSLEIIDDPEGPYRIVTKNAEGERTGCREVRTLGGVLLASANKGCFEVLNKDGDSLIQINREEPVRNQEIAQETQGISPEVAAILQQIQGTGKTVLIVKQEGQLHLLGIIPESVKPGKMIAIDNDTMVRVIESDEEFTLAEVMEHVTMAESSTALMFNIEACDCGMEDCDCKCGKADCPCCSKEKNEATDEKGDIFFYGSMKEYNPKSGHHFSPKQIKIWSPKEGYPKTTDLPLAFRSKADAMKDWHTAKETAHLMRLDRKDMIHLVQPGQTLSLTNRPPEPPQKFRATAIMASKLRQAVSGKVNEGMPGEPYQPPAFSRFEDAVLERSKNALLLDRTKMKGHALYSTDPKNRYVVYMINARFSGEYDSFASLKKAKELFDKRK